MRLEHFLRKLASFRRDRKGAVAVLFAATLIAMFLFVGLALDYSRALRAKTTLRSAADAAALAALSSFETDFANNVNEAQMVQNAQTMGQNAFVANAGKYNALVTGQSSVVVQRNGQTLTATVSYTAQSPNLFGAFANVLNMNINGSGGNSVVASATLPSYLNFYLLLDVSELMGIPSTPDEIARLAAINPDFRNPFPGFPGYEGGCTIACHFTAYQACQNSPTPNPPTAPPPTYCQGFDLTRTAGNSQNTPVNQTPPYYCQQPGTSACIQLRLDAVAYATQLLIQTAISMQNNNHLSNEFGIGLYPFVRWMQPLQSLTTNLPTVQTAAAQLTNWIDNGYGQNTPSFDSNGNPLAYGVGSGGTHFENALPAVNSLIATVGDGSNTASPRPFVFLVTDGAQDKQYQQNNGSWTGSNHATTLDTTNCDAIKNRGVTLAVLYVPYVPIPNPTTIWNDEDDYANNNIPDIPPALQSCASPGFFFEASSPSDINNSMVAMFAMAVRSARLTQ